MAYEPLNEVFCNANSISELDDEKQLSIFPNPAQNNFHVELPDQNFSLEISDPIGRKIYSQKNIFDKTEIDCGDLLDGIYFIRVAVKESTFSRKIIIVR